MGVLATWVSPQAVFLLAAVFAIPALYCLVRLPRAVMPHRPIEADGGGSVFRNRRLLGLLVCCGLYHLANAAMLPLAAGEITRVGGGSAPLIIAAAIVLPQILVAAGSPAVGRFATSWARRPLLVIGFATLPIRGVLFAVSHGALPLVLIQILDGIGAAAFGVLVPLVVADLTARQGHFNLGMGAVGLSVSLGATLSTTLAGVLSDQASPAVAFLALAAAGAVAAGLVGVLVGETGAPNRLDGRRGAR